MIRDRLLSLVEVDAFVRLESIKLVGADQADFALATYVETHDPVPELADAVAGVREPDANATVAKRDALAETMSSVGDLR